MSDQLTAVEFFSGIGAFAEACRGSSIHVIAAYDQNEHANKVYESNFHLRPIRRNLERLKADDVPAATIWWMSPPCTPFSRRGEQKDDSDPRAQALINLIELLPDCLPEHFFLENVSGFTESRVKARLVAMLQTLGYRYRSVELCSSMFGVPMRRPRHFMVASRVHEPVLAIDFEPLRDKRELKDYLTADQNDQRLVMIESELERYRPVLNIVDPSEGESYVICFTRGYYKCRKASGSLIQLPDGRVRFISPKEILDLFGFSDQFQFPSSVNYETSWRLIGNSVDVRAIKLMLSTLGISA